MHTEILTAAQGLAAVLGLGTLIDLRPAAMGEGECGWSGAAVCRVEARFVDGARGTMILKQTDLKERMAMKTLTDQGHRNTPAAFSADLSSDAPRWMAQQDVGCATCPPPGTDGAKRVAQALAGIHADNLGRGGEMPWLPHADGRYFSEYLLTQISVDHFEALMERDAGFAGAFGRYLPRLREKAGSFARDMAALYAEGDSLTLTHGDMQAVDGDHVRYLGDAPYIIDFGWCRYAPLYIDLASYFTWDQAKVYFDCLRRRDVPIKWADFEERLRAAIPYGGFVYLCPAVRQWGAGPTEETGRALLQRLRIILSGDFPERRMGYSDGLFRDLLRMHGEGML